MLIFPPALKAKPKLFHCLKPKIVLTQNTFRPISLLSTLSKLLEKHPFQSGFRRQRSCHTALIRLCDTWLSAVNKTQVAGAVFLDLKRAFDLVDHSIRLRKITFVCLQNLSTVSFLTSYLQDRMGNIPLKA